ncbi:hypothetical protein [Azotobacter chroococcum]|uniref:Abortive phage infection protein n=1 Tax=Azotobacter chroococcum TaxID=353 RepID=A0AAP9YDA4_9GAMM|nr:hypothetical protein [Azotobacter chroococcum]QQE88563.1 hypothetical protein GKQ51_20405 [Azotobacter chroococcum]
MSIENEVIVRIHDASRQKYPLQKITGNIALSSMIDLIHSVNLDANPRLAKTGRVTQDIQESLVNESEIFQFMTKGILIAASEVEELDRSRFRLRFEEPQLEGILDGGHNTLAAGRQILLDVLTAELGAEEAESLLKAIKTWESLKTAWETHHVLLVKHKDEITKALMPIEVIFPGDGQAGYEYFQEKVLVINAARNNNAELTVEAKQNKRGYYGEIRSNLDSKLIDEVEWKTNDGGRIKVRDLVALALVPLSVLPFNALNPISNNPSILFSSKGQCIKIYSDLLTEGGVTEKVTGDIIQIVDSSIKSALALMKDMPKLFDLIYQEMPKAYNSTGGRFGKIDHVLMASDGKKLRTRYYRNPVEYSYGEGYIYPLVYALSALIKNDDGKLSWKTDPEKFIRSRLGDIMKSFYSMIQGQNFDPAKVGKAGGAYNLARDMFAAAYKDEILKLHGLA